VPGSRPRERHRRQQGADRGEACRRPRSLSRRS
jgi:hypothetical protein